MSLITMGQTACLAIAIAAGACGKGDTNAAPHDDEPAKKTYVYTPSDSIAQLTEECVDGRIADACHRLATRYFRGDGVAKDFAKVVEMTTHECDLGVPRACDAVGVSLAYGRNGVAADPAKAAPMLDRACDGTIAPSCTLLGDLYREGRGVVADPDRALALYEKGCEAGDADGCWNGGAARHARGDRAGELLLVKRGCDLKDEHACSKLAHLMR